MRGDTVEINGRRQTLVANRLILTNARKAFILSGSVA
jgi:hypothetical protein